MAADLEWAEAFLVETLGGRLQARRGELVDALGDLGSRGDPEGIAGQGVVAEIDGHRTGLITWAIPDADAGDGAELSAVAVAETARGVAEVRAVAVAETARGLGVGRALLAAAEVAIRAAGARRAWLVTTNDNLTALALYQKAGWQLSALRPGAIDELRQGVKPAIPKIGQHGIPLRDELELTKEL